MPLQATPYTAPLAFSAALGFAAALITWKKRDSKAETWFSLAMLSIALWSTFLLLTVSVTTLTAKLLGFKLFIMTPILVTVAMFVFGLHYTGRQKWVNEPLTAALTLIVAAAVAVLVTAPHLIIQDPRLTHTGSHVELQYSWGIGVWMFAAVLYAVNAAYLSMLFLKFLRSRNVYRKISFLLFTSTGVMMAATLVSLAGFSPLPHLMLLPYTFLVIGVIAVVSAVTVKAVQVVPLEKLLSVAGSRFESLVPLARDYVVEQMDSGVVVLDDGCRIVDVNRTGKEMLGDRRPVGKKINDVVDPDAILEGDDVLDALQPKTGVPEFRDEVWVRTPEGDRCYDINLTNLEEGGEDGGGHVILIHDITQQKEREEKLDERKRKLEHQNERLDDFAGIVSHDLRNPLNVAEGYVAMIRDKLDASDEIRDDLEEVESSLERMEDIVEDALTLARQGKAITDTEEVTVADAAREAWDNVDTQDAELHVDCDTVLEADRPRLLNVFENLYRNAVEHGGGDVTVRVGGLGVSDGFYVEDDGEGIPADERDQVLEQGYTTSDGTGLGLSIVKDIANAHGWDVEVTESDEGGARFEIKATPIKRQMMN